MKKIICKNVSKSYKKKIVLDNINIEIELDKICGLIGHNGAGKTTLLSLVAAHNPVTSGEIKLDDEICSVLYFVLHIILYLVVAYIIGIAFWIISVYSLSKKHESIALSDLEVLYWKGGV